MRARASDFEITRIGAYARATAAAEARQRELEAMIDAAVQMLRAGCDADDVVPLLTSADNAALNEYRENVVDTTLSLAHEIVVTTLPSTEIDPGLPAYEQALHDAAARLETKRQLLRAPGGE